MFTGRMLHTGRYKYADYRTGARREELYDLQTAPGELRNLAQEPSHADALDDCRARLAQWRLENNDSAPQRGATA